MCRLADSRLDGNWGSAVINRDDYDHLVEGLLEQLNMGRSFSELFSSIYAQLQGIVPYNRIGVALLEEPEGELRLTSCRSDGEVLMKMGYAARVEGSTLEPLLETGQPRIINDLEGYLAAQAEFGFDGAGGPRGDAFQFDAAARGRGQADRGHFLFQPREERLP